VDRVEFRVGRHGGGTGDVETIVPFVDGRALPDLLRVVESPFAAREGRPSLAGAYAGLDADAVRWPSRHYLGEPVLRLDGSSTVLLGCTCGDWGCWPFAADVRVDGRTVTWTGYRHGSRDWDYRACRTFTFLRAEYEHAVIATAAHAP
jgi:hypothetical protein